nr:uncharacterized protein LOC112940334 [Solanum lycopersicum]
MLMNRPQIEQHIQWKLQAGNCSFWWDNWLGSGPLAQFTNNNNRFNNSKVADFWEAGKWSWSRLLEQAPASQLSKILTTEISPHQHLPDQAVWNLNNHGGFTCSPALEEIREKKAKKHFNSQLWHKNIPFKSSFLLWRTLRGKLPTNDKLINFDIQPSNCVCCFDKSGTDCIEHIFNSGNFAAKVWSSFAATTGMLPDFSSLQVLLQQWWTATPKNAAHKLLMQATQIFICWNLWKNRCAAKYGGKTTNISRVKYVIYKDTYKMLNTAFPQVRWLTKWTDLIQMSER